MRKNSQSTYDLVRPASKPNIYPAIALCLLLQGCGGVSPYDFPTPIATPDGGRGFGMIGYVQYTSSEDKARSWINTRLSQACGSDIEILNLKLFYVSCLIRAKTAVFFTPVVIDTFHNPQLPQNIINSAALAGFEINLL